MDRATKLTRSDTMPHTEAALAQAYLYAKKSVLNSPYGIEVLDLWREPSQISESEFLQELAWVILSAGMAETIVRRKFPEISKCFYNWESARRISNTAEECIETALSHFRPEGKIRGIAPPATLPSPTDPLEKLLE